MTFKIQACINLIHVHPNVREILTVRLEGAEKKYNTTHIPQQAHNFIHLVLSASPPKQIIIRFNANTKQPSLQHELQDLCTGKQCYPHYSSKQPITTDYRQQERWSLTPLYRCAILRLSSSDCKDGTMETAT
jgi:hypothetical protein